MDVIAGIALAAKLNSGAVTGPRFMSQSMPLSVMETKQGMYKEYTVDKVDDSALDEIRRGYKTAEETDEGKTKVYHWSRKFYQAYSDRLHSLTAAFIVLGNFCSASRR